MLYLPTIICSVVLAGIFDVKVPLTIEEKKQMLLTHHVAVWDVIASCDIEGSADSSIKNVVANDLNIILKEAKIEKIIVNGKTAEKYYNKYIKDKINRDAICMPSTSPATSVRLKAL